MFKQLTTIILIALLLAPCPAYAAPGENGDDWVEDEEVYELVPGQVRFTRPAADPMDSVEQGWFTENNYGQPPLRTPQPPYNEQGDYYIANPMILSGEQGELPGLVSPVPIGVLPPQKKPNSFLNPPPVPWLNSLGRGIKSIGTGSLEAAQSTSNVLSSPEFWNTAAGAAALGGAGYWLYRMNRNSPQSVAVPNSVNPDHVRVNSYRKTDGTFVNSHMRTAPDGTKTNNFSHYGNYNPYTGKVGSYYP